MIPVITDQPPVKRPRDDDSRQSAGSSNAQPTINKSDDFWLDDGNIILACESTGFRVHRGVLAMHSPVFKDMLALGNPESEQGFEGCPVVVLPDAAGDVLHMLKALYYRDYPPAEKVQLELLAPLLRMATKYMLGSLRKELTSRLQVLFPDTLDAYASADRANHLRGGLIDADAELGVELGVTCDLPIILPIALYLSACGLQIQMHSLKRLLPPTDDTNLNPHAVRFLNNWNHLLDNVFATLDDQPFWKTLEDGRWKCLSHHACDGLPFEAKRQMETRCRRLTVNVMKQPIIKVPQTWMICGACKDNVWAYEHQLRGKLWDILPAACGYTSWDALRNEQSEDSA